MQKMRRYQQQLTKEECIQILINNTSGVLSLYEDKDYPYAVPMSYVYEEQCLYFHSATQGHKLDVLRKNNKVAFCVIDQDDVVSEEYTTYYKSVIVKGEATILENEVERKAALISLGTKYSPNISKDEIAKEYEKARLSLCMIKVDIIEISGKQAKELVKKG